MNIERQDIINSIKSKDRSFEGLALDLFDYQRNYNQVFRSFLDLIDSPARSTGRLEDLVFMPITLFKSNTIKTGEWNEEKVFKSSGTMGTRSRHYIRSLGWYERNALQIFENTYGLVGNYSMLAYLPNYYQNPDSSLIHMVCDFMEAAGQNPHKSFIKNHSHLSDRLSIYLKENKRVLLFGVSFALLDYAIHHKHVDARNLTVIETGGMKRFAAEITRAELHRRLSDCFVGAQIHSEYGMTECLSQLYSTEGGSFKMNDRMRALIGDPSDPRAILDDGNIGQVQIIDLANIDTLSFIRTDDLGKINTDGTLEILGRANASDLRGCNYLI